MFLQKYCVDRLQSKPKIQHIQSTALYNNTAAFYQVKITKGKSERSENCVITKILRNFWLVSLAIHTVLSSLFLQKYYCIFAENFWPKSFCKNQPFCQLLLSAESFCFLYSLFWFRPTPLQFISKILYYGSIYI